MRLLQRHFLFPIILFQCLQMKCAIASSDASWVGLTPKKQLMRFYRSEFNRLAGEICPKLYAISVQILNDDSLEHVTKPLMQDFQKNLTQFQIIYPYYVRFGLNESLAIVFSQMMQDFYTRKSSDLKEFTIIKQLLANAGYQALREQYKIVLENFFHNKFSHKYEQLKKQISNRSQLVKFEQRFAKCIEKAKVCENYECLLTNFRTTILKPKDKFIGNVQRHIFDIMISILREYKNVYERIVKHPQFSRLSGPLKRHLIKNYQSSTDNYAMINDFNIMFHLGAQDLLQEFMIETTAPKQQQLLQQIFMESDYNAANENYIKDFRRFIQTDFINEVENFKAAFQREGSAEDVPYVQLLENVKRSSSEAQLAAAFMSLNIFERTQLKKWRL